MQKSYQCTRSSINLNLIFFLRFTGYRKEPSTEAELNNVLNNFTVKNCEIILTDRPKKNVFIIRGLHLTTVVERTFHTDSEAERWEIHSSPTIHFHYYKKDPKNFIESRSPSRYERSFCILEDDLERSIIFILTQKLKK